MSSGQQMGRLRFVVVAGWGRFQESGAGKLGRWCGGALQLYTELGGVPWLVESLVAFPAATASDGTHGE